MSVITDRQAEEEMELEWMETKLLGTKTDVHIYIVWLNQFRSFCFSDMEIRNSRSYYVLHIGLCRTSGCSSQQSWWGPSSGRFCMISGSLRKGWSLWNIDETMRLAARVKGEALLLSMPGKVAKYCLQWTSYVFTCEIASLRLQYYLWNVYAGGKAFTIRGQIRKLNNAQRLEEIIQEIRQNSRAVKIWMASH